MLVNPSDAETRGIASGDMVQVFNARGVFDAVAKVTPDTMPGVVVSPMGYWGSRSSGGRTVNAINPPTYADYGRAPTFSDTLVEVGKAMDPGVAA